MTAMFIDIKQLAFLAIRLFDVIRSRLASLEYSLGTERSVWMWFAEAYSELPL